MMRIGMIALLGLVASTAAGCSDTYYAGDYGRSGYHDDAYHRDHDRHQDDRDDVGATYRDEDRGYPGHQRRTCRDEDGRDYPC